MEEVFYKRYPKKRPLRKEGSTALIMDGGRLASDGEAFFVVRFAIREPITQDNVSRPRHNRLAVRRYKSTYYAAKRYEYACMQWGAVSTDPIILSQWQTAAVARKAMRSAHAQHEGRPLRRGWPTRERQACQLT